MLPIKYNNSVASFDKDEFLTPFSALFDELFNKSFNSLDIIGKNFLDNSAYPKVDVFHTENELVIEAEILGLNKNQLTIEIDSNNILRIKGEKKDDSKKKSNHYIHRELKHSSFCRSFSLGDCFDTNNITSEFENGVLKVTIPKIKPTEPSIKKIDIK